ncbi:MAG: DUF433 domain-containing protein [Polyangiales bacterium]
MSRSQEMVAHAEVPIRNEDELPPVRIPHPHVVVSPDLNGGSPTIVGTRVPVRRLFSWQRSGTTVETLFRRYPQLGPARILDALAFAYDNPETIIADLIREREALAREEESRNQDHRRKGDPT